MTTARILGHLRQKIADSHCSCSSCVTDREVFAAISKTIEQFDKHLADGDIFVKGAHAGNDAADAIDIFDVCDRLSEAAHDAKPHTDQEPIP